MNGNVVYVGIDVDDVQYHGSALDRRTGEVLSFHCRPTLKGLVGQLENLRKRFGEAELKLCYEASYVGFSLQRDLHNKGYALCGGCAIKYSAARWEIGEDGSYRCGGTGGVLCERLVDDRDGSAPASFRAHASRPRARPRSTRQNADRA